MQPKNLKEAQNYRYQKWIVEPNGRAYSPNRCAYESPGRGMTAHQCYRKAGHGTDKIFCKQHAKMMESDNG